MNKFGISERSSLPLKITTINSYFRFDIHEDLIFFPVSAEAVDVEEYELASDTEQDRIYYQSTLKLTSHTGGSHRSGRGRATRRGLAPPYGSPPPRSRSRDAPKKEIQEDDEATLRELLIRYF